MIQFVSVNNWLIIIKSICFRNSEFLGQSEIKHNHWNYIKLSKSKVRLPFTLFKKRNADFTWNLVCLRIKEAMI